MRILAKIVALLAASLFIFLTPSEAQAKPTHWEHSVVYVENHAPGWPVRRAANNIDNGSGLELIVVDKCPSDVQCIKVYTIRNLSGRTIGHTRWWYSNDRTVKATVWLENKWGNTASSKQRRGLVCHELGHAIGLSHSKKKNTCMKPGASKNRPAHISKSERRKLNRWY